MFVRHAAVLGAALLVSLAAAPFTRASTIYDSAQVEAIVRAYFSDIPVLIEVARCESGFRQFASDGSALTDPSGSWVGAFQISRIHSTQAKAFGYDINTLEGNMMYARYLHTKNGLTDWNSSKSCWGSAIVQTPVANVPAASSAPIRSATTSASVASIQTSDIAAGAIEIPLSLGVEKPSVMTLQRALNHAGFIVAASGPGSPGKETGRFGALTRAAVRKFQCAKFSLCSGDENTNGYGVVGPRTLAALQTPGSLSLNR